MTRSQGSLRAAVGAGLLALLLLGCQPLTWARWRLEQPDGNVTEGRVSLILRDGSIRAWKSILEEVSKAVNPKTGKWVLQSPGGRPFTEGTFLEGQAHGLFRSWDRRGRLVDETTYANGVENGRMTLWNPNGRKQMETTYIDGRETGMHTEWYRSGRTRLVYQYRAGLPHGRQQRWDDDGILVEDGIQSNGLPWSGTLVIRQRVGGPPVLGAYEGGHLVRETLWRKPGSQGR